jgi:cation:H+ antiporter
MALTITTLIIGLIILILGGDYLVKGASSIALRLNLSPLVVGLTIVAFGTSAPELLISIQSALKGSPDIATGNVIGSNICNLGLVLGVAAVIRPVIVRRESLVIDWPVTMGSSILLFVVMKKGCITAWDGILFVAILSAFLIYMIKRSKTEYQGIEVLDMAEETKGVPDAPKKQIVKDIVFIILGSLGLYYGSEWFVGSVKTLALEAGIEERVVGLTLVALGTSLPELVTAAVASYKGHTDLAIGNLMGSNIFNILSILGITSIVKTITVNEEMLNKDLIWMLLITLMILPLMIIKRKVGRIDGALLILVYVVYIYFVVV